jgi:hypothetical protein
MTATESMLERVAGAIGYALAIMGADLDDAPLEAAARAAIEAMREPTEAMTSGWFEQSSGKLASIWRALIDRALADAPQGVTATDRTGPIPG